MKLLYLLTMMATFEPLEEFEEFCEHEEFEVVRVEEEYKEVIPEEEYASENFLLFERFVAEGDAVVDFGGKRVEDVLALSHLVGQKGKVLVVGGNCELEPLLEKIEQYSLTNIELQDLAYFEDLEEGVVPSFALLDLNGKEEEVLWGLPNIPAMILNLTGGIPEKHIDRFIRPVVDLRAEKLQKKGYTLQSMGEGYYLIVSEKKSL